jgi:hypothetical protein
VVNYKEDLAASNICVTIVVKLCHMKRKEERDVKRCLFAYLHLRPVYTVGYPMGHPMVLSKPHVKSAFTRDVPHSTMEYHIRYPTRYPTV